MATLNSVNGGRYTLQGHITVDPLDENVDIGIDVPAQYEDIFIERLGFDRDGGFQTKTIPELMNDHRIDSLSIVPLSPFSVPVIEGLGVSVVEVDYDPAQAAGSRVNLQLSVTNGNDDVAVDIFVSIGLSHSINR